MVKGVPIGIDIIERIAQREGVEPEQLNAKLYESIDPDALAALTSDRGEAQPDPGPQIEFTFHGYVVIVDGLGAVTIDEQQPDEGMGGAPSEGPVGG